MTSEHQADGSDQGERHLERIRSFVLRAGRTTGGQQRAIEELGPQFLIPFQETLLNLEHAFSGSTNPKILEIGFAMGETTARIADLRKHCLLYTSPSPRDRQKSRMPSSA